MVASRLTSVALVLGLAAPLAADARDKSMVRQFRAAYPCPGYVVDHVTPLCAGGADHPSNMQWQTVEDAKIKDREERRLCGERRAKDS